MSRLSIFETRWIDLVFENRNQEYGAYPLRRDSVKTSLTALLLGLLFVASISGISTIASHCNREIAIANAPEVFSSPIIEITKINLHQIEEKKAVDKTETPIHETTIVKERFVNPTIVDATKATQEIATNIENKHANKVLTEGTAFSGTNTSSLGTSNRSETENTNEVDYGTTIVSSAILDKTPQFPGGIEKFYKYVGTNFEKPEMDTHLTFQIFVSFIIEKDGSMTAIKVVRDPGYGLGQEAIRVLQSLKTKWSPGMMGSKPVRTAYNLPISIQMQ